MTYDEWFKSLNENGRTTYFLGQEGVVSKEAWDYQQKEIDRLKDVIENTLNYVENGGYTPNWIIREFLK